METLNFSALRKKIELLHDSDSAVSEVNDKKSLHLTKQAEKALKTTFLEAKLYKSDAISTAHLLLCIFIQGKLQCDALKYKNSMAKIASNKISFFSVYTGK